MVILGTKKPSQAKLFMDAILAPMSECGNSHGVGYTAIKKDGSIFTERWLDNKIGLKGDPNIPVKTEDSIMKKKFRDAISIKEPEVKDYSSQGELASFGDVRSVIMHTRFATCDKTFDNVHPFVDNENVTSIAHNGVVDNDEEFDKLNSTCDSEVFLTEYNRLEIGKNPANVSDLVESIEGYWATVATTLDEVGHRVIDVFTSNTSPRSGSLVVTYIKELDGFVMCSTSDTIKTALKTLNWDLNVTMYEINNYVFNRFDGTTGVLIHQTSHADIMESFSVDGKSNKGHTRHYSSSKTRRSLPKGEETKEQKQKAFDYGNWSGINHEDDINVRSNGVGNFYSSDQCEKIISVKTMEVVKQSELSAIDRWEAQQAAVDKKEKTMLNKTCAYVNMDSVSNFQDQHDTGTDGKYSVLDAELTDVQLDQLDIFESKLNDREKELINCMSTDSKYLFLQGMKGS
tara:strand:+ start:2697 stop:4070 length:1374 start_codon:yes stop_codon:yes gene_type:complete